MLLNIPWLNIFIYCSYHSVYSHFCANTRLRNRSIHFEKRNIYTSQETELIYALLEGIYITTEKSKPIIKTEEEKLPVATKSYNLILFIIIGFIGLGMLIIIFYRKKKSRNTKERKFKI